MIKLPFRISLRLGLSLSFILLALILSSVITGVIFTTLQRSMREDIRVRLHDIVFVGVSRIEGDEHKKLGRTEEEGSKVYGEIKKIMKNIQLHSTDIRFVYTLRRIDTEKFIFVVDSEDDSEHMSHLGDFFDSKDAEEAYQSSDPVWIDDQFSTDKWGTWLTAYSKIYTSDGDVDALLGIDISAKLIVERERAILTQTGIIIFIFTILFLLIGVWLSKTITKPLAELERDISSIKKLDLNQTISINSVFKEILSIYQAEGNMKKGLRSFKKFVSPELVNQLISQNSEAELGGEKKELTIFFSDIVEFTTLSEKMDPVELTEFLKEYFAGMSEIILKHGGTIDKFIGDSIMAFWGAPHSVENHGLSAVKAALECRAFLDKLNASHMELNLPILETRFGLNSGEVVVGNFGYNERFNYTVFGDNVNIAARLEALNKYYGTDILISENLYRLVNEVIIAKKIDVVALRGKKQDIGIYQVIGEKKEMNSQEVAYIASFNSALEFYFEGNFELALNELRKLKQTGKSDKRRDEILSICEQYHLNSNV